MHDVNYIHDHEMMKIVKKMKRGGIRGAQVVARSRRRLLKTRFGCSETSFSTSSRSSSSKSKRMASRVSLLQVEVAFDLNSE